MRRMIMSVVVSVLLGGFTVAASQLPPEIMADRLLVQAERQIGNGDYATAVATLDRILALQAEHGLEIPGAFWFKHAQVSLEAGLHAQAVESATRYLQTVGQEGEHYREALELLDEVEVEIEELKEQRERMAREAQEARARAAREQEAREARAMEARARASEVSKAMEFVRIPAGEFRMGSTSRAADAVEQPVTRVRISRAFDLGKYEVTQSEWQGVMGTNPSEFSGCAQCPVELVSWDDAQEFIRRLNAVDGEGTYRLPTEAEWEYAARAGTTGDRYGNLDAIAWHRNNSGDRTHPVGQKTPNAWGLHDMLGNVYEWVEDWYGDYPGGTVTDPRGPDSGSYRVVRGGGWISRASGCRSSFRFDVTPGSRYAGLGFRLLRTE